MVFAEVQPGALVVTQDGSLTMSHGEHGECFHNQAGAETEARELNVKASGFEAELAKTDLAVLDVGLGLGYNAVVTIEAWFAESAARDLDLTSLEIDPKLVAALVTGAAPWQENWTPERIAFCRALRIVTPSAAGASGIFSATFKHSRSGATLTWNVHVLDGRASDLPDAAAGWDFIWQDPFSPEKNPGMWNSAWFAKVARGAKPGAVLMTYSVSRAVRDALAAAGWAPERIPSRLPPKRQWLVARRI